MFYILGNFKILNACLVQFFKCWTQVVIQFLGFKVHLLCFLSAVEVPCPIHKNIYYYMNMNIVSRMPDEWISTILLFWRRILYYSVHIHFIYCFWQRREYLYKSFNILAHILAMKVFDNNTHVEIIHTHNTHTHKHTLLLTTYSLNNLLKFK